MKNNIEKGFILEDGTYLQICGDASDVILEGAVEVPLKPSHFHQFVDGEWVEQPKEEQDKWWAAIARAKRDKLLKSEVDAVVSNPLRWAEMSDEQQQQWADYRTALLDLTYQDGFPQDIQWPEKPE